VTGEAQMSENTIHVAIASLTAQQLSHVTLPSAPTGIDVTAGSMLQYMTMELTSVMRVTYNVEQNALRLTS
jgi:hypothetical protein